MNTYDYAIIGAGVSGLFAARALSRYKSSIVVLDTFPEAGFGTSKANSGIVHCGAKTTLDTLKGRLVHKGNEMFTQLQKELKFSFIRCGELVVAQTEADYEHLEHLKGIADSKGIPYEEVDAEKLHEMEPKLSTALLGGLHFPTTGVVNPYELCFALMDSARNNGTEFALPFKVTGISKEDGIFTVVSDRGDSIRCRVLINAAGVNADEVSRMAGDDSFEITPRKGEEYLLDKKLGKITERVIFPTPTKTTKGTLLIPTVDGTMMIGPTAEEVDERDDLGTSSLGIANIFEKARNLCPLVSERDVIASFAGLRAVPDKNDFIICLSKKVRGLVQVAGILSPGLTAAPMIGEYVLELIQNSDLVDDDHPLIPDEDYNPSITEFKIFSRMTPEEQELAVAKDKRYCDVVCRCELVTRMDVEEAIDRGATTIDGIKFRTRAGMGRCQGSFCSSRLLQILSTKLSKGMEELTKKGGESKILSQSFADDPRYKYAKLMMEKRISPAAGEAAVKRVKEEVVDVMIIGGGPAGMAAAVAAREAGAESVVIFDREADLGGILLQCIHSGFGLEYFKEELTGPEFAARWKVKALGSGATIFSSAFVFELGKVGEYFQARVLLKEESQMVTAKSKSVVLATGSRERSRAAVGIPGERPSGVYTAGFAQKLINILGYFPGKKAVILGSGDIGLVMARRLVLENCVVTGVYELLPHPSGLKRNIVQCLDDFGIPLHISHTVVKIHGTERLEKVTIAPVESMPPFKPIMEKAFDVECDTLLLSVGLIPENEIAMNLGIELNPKTSGPVVNSNLMGSMAGVFACGNVLHVNDIADNVTMEGLMAGKSAAGFVRQMNGDEPVISDDIKLSPGLNVGYVVPASLRSVFYDNEKNATISFRSKKIMSKGIINIGPYKKRVSSVVPAEMIILKLSKRDIEKLKTKITGDSGDFQVDLNEVAEKVPAKKLVASEEPKKEKVAGGDEPELEDGSKVTLYTCTNCPNGCQLKVTHMGKNIIKIEGNQCKKGEKYAKQEHIDPRRVFSTTIPCTISSKLPRVPVKVSAPIPKDKIRIAAKAVQEIVIDKEVAFGGIICENIAQLGVDLISCRDVVNDINKE